MESPEVAMGGNAELCVDDILSRDGHGGRPAQLATEAPVEPGTSRAPRSLVQDRSRVAEHLKHEQRFL